MAKDPYDTNVYTVVSYYASVMVKMGKTLAHAVWHITFSNYVANVLEKIVLNKPCTDNVINILQEFKHVDFESEVVKKGGNGMKLPCETRWCSYRDAYNCFLRSLQYMKLVAADTK